MPTISILSGRVRDPNTDDWEKGRQMVRYLKCTRELHLILRYDGLKICKWHVDASFAVHPDFRSHSGGVMFMHELGGGMASGSVKQKLNTRSSTTSELVAADDFLPKIIWVKNFLKSQGISLDQNVLYQDNQSAMLLEKKGRASCGKWTRALNIRYFAIKDCWDRGELKIEYLPTDVMAGDFMTKPLQGEKFRKFRKLILGM